MTAPVDDRDGALESTASLDQLAAPHGAREALPVAGPEAAGLPPALAALTDEAADLARGSRSRATWRTYESDWREFGGWCAGHGLAAYRHHTAHQVVTSTGRLSLLPRHGRCRRGA